MSELPEPEVHGLLVHMTELLGLAHRHPLCPAPQERPEGPETEAHMLQPRVGQQREASAAFGTPVPILLPPHVPRSAFRAEHVLAEDDVAQPLLNLSFRRTLLERGDHENGG